MNKEESKVNFDLSTLKLSELVNVYTEINEFVDFLNESKIVQEEDDADE
ncbi:MAG: hypothetical protein PHD02_02025 [Bacilli bacterium]|nr:hypothetical protein [Bacilli bacterium]